MKTFKNIRENRIGTDICSVCGQTPCNCTHIEEHHEESVNEARDDLGNMHKVQVVASKDGGEKKRIDMKVWAGDQGEAKGIARSRLHAKGYKTHSATHMGMDYDWLKKEDKDPCWDNYKQIGMKMKNGKKVPNCVPKEGVAEGSMATKHVAPVKATPLSTERPKGEWDPIHGKAPKKGTVKYDIWRQKVSQDKKGVVEDWQKVNKSDKTDGMSQKAVNAYRREHPGSKLKTAVTTKPSKLKAGSKAANRRKSFCARMSGMKRAHASAETKRDPDSPINKALRRWNCNEENINENNKKRWTDLQADLAIVKENLEEGDVVKFPKKHQGDLESMHSCQKCGGELQGGTYMGHKVKVCHPCKQVYLPPNSGIDKHGNMKEEVVAEADQLQGTPVVSLSDLTDKDYKKNKYGQTVPKKLKQDDPRVKFHKDEKKGVAEESELGDLAHQKTLKHRFLVTYSDPNHTASTMRKVKQQKHILAPSVDKHGRTVYMGEAKPLVKKYMNKQGYRVHEIEHVGMVSKRVNESEE